MMRHIALFILLCGSAWATVPVNTCHVSVGSATTANCTIASVGAHHAILAFWWTNNNVTHTYTDTAGNSSVSLGNCSSAPTTSFTPCAGALSVYDLTYSSGLATQGLIAVSSGTFTGSDTFTMSVSGGAVGIEIFVAEYSDDLIAFEQTANNFVTTITTTGANDLVVVQAGKGFFCNFTTAAAGFTLEFVSNTTCHAMADRTSLPPGTYTGTITETTGGADIESFTAFGVAPFVALTRHRSQVY